MVKVEVPAKYIEVMQRLSNNKRIVILEQDRSRAVVIMNRSAYLEKCLTLINTSHFHKLTEDSTRPTEDKYKDL